MSFDAHRLSFGAIAEHYDRARPTYPADAVAWAVGTKPERVLDLGAGTGKLTAVALSLGLDLVSVEPDPGMRERFRYAIGHEALAGSAEEIPLPDGSVDAVIVGQAYHWFTPDKAHPEIARVLKPGGVFAPMWNRRSLKEPWTKRLDEIMNGNRVPPWSTQERENFGPLFGPLEHKEFHHCTWQTAQGVEDLVASRSHFLVAPPERRAELRQQVRDLVKDMPGDGFELPYTTLVRRCVRKPSEARSE